MPATRTATSISRIFLSSSSPSSVLPRLLTSDPDHISSDHFHLIHTSSFLLCRTETPHHTRLLLLLFISFLLLTFLISGGPGSSPWLSLSLPSSRPRQQQQEGAIHLLCFFFFPRIITITS
ncbi:hypothetical protein CRG98_016546 [Punica granatum]|uniref:Uncharacterized protein n=1 Tax=Punica granatum TaxID=22663 RepID=A0A2I0K3D6_PUNGR|nr:hypothetical protein CRG98_016546 [Punica granatum]